jgi:hypothetical protein
MPDGPLRTIHDYPFRFVSLLEPERDAAGAVARFLPQARYAKRSTSRLHRYGAGPFCRFRVRTNAGTGVYAFVVADAVRYVGKCDILALRLNEGYGRISPKNCYIGGQQTNCRVNTLVLEAVERGEAIGVWFFGCTSPDDIEARLIDALQPPWNLAGSDRR